jgi:hypothetical protein
MLWALLRRQPTVPVPSVLLSRLWLAEAMGLDIIRQPRDGSASPAWLLEPAELVELLASHAGESWAAKSHWLSSSILAPSAIGQSLGALVPPEMTMLQLQATVVTRANQVCLWREAAWWYLVGRRLKVLGALKAGLQGIHAKAPHPLLTQLRTLSFDERQAVVSGNENPSAEAVIATISLAAPNKTRKKMFERRGLSILQNYEWLLELIRSDEFRPHLAEFLRFATGCPVLTAATNITVGLTQIEAGSIPIAHTCFNKVDMPDTPYTSQRAMLGKLLLCCEASTGFGAK